MITAYRSTLATVLLGLMGCFAHAQEKVTPVAEYEAHVQYALIMCKLTFSIAQAQIERTTIDSSLVLTPEEIKKGDYASCISDMRGTAANLYKKAVGSTKKAAAVQALKNLHVSFLNALQGVSPQQNEVRGLYRSRQQELQTKVDDAINRVDIEL